MKKLSRRRSLLRRGASPTGVFPVGKTAQPCRISTCWSSLQNTIRSKSARYWMEKEKAGAQTAAQRNWCWKLQTIAISSGKFFREECVPCLLLLLCEKNEKSLHEEWEKHVAKLQHRSIKEKSVYKGIKSPVNALFSPVVMVVYDGFRALRR